MELAQGAPQGWTKLAGKEASNWCSGGGKGGGTGAFQGCMLQLARFWQGLAVCYALFKIGWVGAWNVGERGGRVGAGDTAGVSKYRIGGGSQVMKAA